MRFEGTTFIEQKMEGIMDDLRIVPHILVTIVENACKHGDLTDKFMPLQISAVTEKGWFIFEVKNKIRMGRSVEQGDGTGLINLDERIKLQYGDQQQFQFGLKEGYFVVTFKLSVARMELDALIQKTEVISSFDINSIETKQTVWLPA